MKTRAIFGTFASGETKEVLFNQLWEIFPEARCGPRDGRRAIHIDAAIEDPRVEKARALLESHGMKPWDRVHPMQADEYRLELRRTYESIDCQESQFFDVKPLEEDYFVARRSPLPGGGHRLELDNYLDLPIADKPIIGLAAVGEYFLVCSQIRSALKASGLQHLVFRASVVLDSRSSGDILTPLPEGMYWEVTSDLQMPPLHPVNLITEKGEPYTGDPKSGCIVKDGMYSPGQMHYRRSALEGLPPFGLALTREWPGRNRLIASRQFYDFCQREGFTLDWIPVRIDD